jgi:hypothetical protein
MARSGHCTSSSCVPLSLKRDLRKAADARAVALRRYVVRCRPEQAHQLRAVISVRIPALLGSQTRITRAWSRSTVHGRR